MSDHKKADVEHSLNAVPLSERRNFFQLVFTWIGYVFTVTIMSAGGNIANGAANFWQCIAAVYTGYAILFLLAILVSHISQKTGYSFGLLTRYSFGAYGSRFISFFTMITLLGWFSINCYLSGSVTHTLFPSIPQVPASMVFGALYTFTALKGQKIMNKLGLVATVLVFLVGVTAIGVGIRDAGGGFCGLRRHWMGAGYHALFQGPQHQRRRHGCGHGHCGPLHAGHRHYRHDGLFPV